MIIVGKKYAGTAWKQARYSIQSILLSLLLLSSLVQTLTTLSMAVDFQIAAEEEDTLVYKINLDGNVTYAHFTINRTIDNASTLIICYNALFADQLTEFNESEVEYSNSTLTGNITEDLFGSMTVLNMILPIGINFTASEADLNRTFAEMDGIEIRLTTDLHGFAIKLEFFLRIIILIKIVEMTYYYSTSGILLLGQTYFRDPRSGDESHGIFEILPDLSTVPGAADDPYNPEVNLTHSPVANTTTSGIFDNETQGVQIDLQGVITIVLGVGGIGGIITAVVVLIKKKKNSVQK